MPTHATRYYFFCSMGCPGHIIIPGPVNLSTAMGLIRRGEGGGRKVAGRLMGWLAAALRPRPPPMGAPSRNGQLSRAPWSPAAGGRRGPARLRPNCRPPCLLLPDAPAPSLPHTDRAVASVGDVAREAGGYLIVVVGRPLANGRLVFIQFEASAWGDQPPSIPSHPTPVTVLVHLDDRGLSCPVGCAGY